MMTTHVSGREDSVPGLHFSTSDIHRQRLRWIFPIFAFIFIAIIVKLFAICFLPGRLAEEDAYHVGHKFIEFPRGKILDRNSMELATIKKVPSIYVDPRQIEDDMALANHLSVHLGMTEEEILPCLTRTFANGTVREMYPVKRWITDIPEKDLKAIVAPYEGILHLKYEEIRHYPYNQSAAHLLGFVNRAGEASEGIELVFDDYLRSKRGEIQARKDRDRNLLPSRLLSYREPEGGDMVQLTLDINIQNILENALDARMAEVGAKAAMGMLMDPQTGAVLALASRPAFDPNVYDDFPAELRKNRALIDVFEPGSAFKIVTASAALEHGLVTPDTMVDCEGGSFNPYGHLIRDFYNLGVIPFYHAFEKSSNIAMIKLGALLGPERLESWIRLYGFGQKTSSDFRFESRGLFNAKEKWSRLSMGSLPMGQEIAVTIPQLARAFAVIANGGFLVQPYFVEKAVSPQGDTTYQHQKPASKQILSPATAKTMLDLCHRVVLHGTGTAANIPEFRAGGKTGTAQMARVGGRGYDPDRYTAVFAGFAPIANPRVVAVIVVQEPSIRQRWGGYVCGPVFRDVVRAALIRMNVPQDPVVDPEKEPEPPLLVAKMTRTTEEQMLKSEPLPEVEASALDPAADLASVFDADTIAPPPDDADLDANLGALISPLDGLALLSEQVIDETSERALPDLTGMSKSQARECLQRLGAIMDAQGAGWVMAQDLPPGTVIEKGTICALQFGDKMSWSAANDAG